MRIAVLLALLVTVTAPSAVLGQRPSRDPAARFALDAHEGFLAFLLAHRAELALSADQVVRLTSLQDSVNAEAQRAAASFGSRAPSRSILAVRSALRRATRDALAVLRPEQAKRARELRASPRAGRP